MPEYFKINKFLLPLSFLYGVGVSIRNKLFDWKILSSEEFHVPVISIGNITIGGTGKTPHTEYLIRLLAKNNKVAVLSRGYKRKTSGFILADEKANSLTIGDEPFQMYRKFPSIIVAVDKDRRRGIRNLLKLPEDIRPEIILLDDAFQHRYVNPGLSILLTDCSRPIYEDALLPAGRLREPAGSKSRANIVIVTKCPDELKPIDYRVISKHLKLYPYQSLFFTSFKYGNLIPIFEESNLPQKKLEDIRKNNVSLLLVAGIASPNRIIETLKKYTNHLEILTYPDHHHFSTHDINKISSKFEQIVSVNKMIITTEKDAVRLISHPKVSENIRKFMYYLPIEVNFNLDQETLFNKKTEEHVKNIKRNRSMA